MQFIDINNLKKFWEVVSGKLDSIEKNKGAKLSWKIYIDADDSPYLPVVCYDKNEDKNIIITDLTSADTENLVPIAIVVIPADHDVYGTGECCAMSLAYMDYENPETGNLDNVDSIHMYWGPSTEMSNIPILKKAVHYGTMDMPPKATIQGITNDTSNNMIPSDKWSGYTYEKDLSTKWYNYSDANRYYCPSPYLTDGTRNPEYYMTSGSYSDNILADFNGKQYTDIAMKLLTGQSGWENADTIVNSTSTGYYPALACVYRFHTEGTKSGDWHLPSAGELGYVGARFKKIDDTVDYINEIFGRVATGIIYNDNLSGVQQGGSAGQIRVSTMNSAIGSQNKSSQTIYRAFIRI